MKISWVPPKEVTYDQIRLRGYIFHRRKFGETVVVEMAVGRIYTDISLIGDNMHVLLPNIQRYFLNRWQQECLITKYTPIFLK